MKISKSCYAFHLADVEAFVSLAVMPSLFTLLNADAVCEAGGKPAGRHKDEMTDAPGLAQ